MAGLLDGVLGTLMNDQVTGQIANKLCIAYFDAGFK